MTVNFPYFSISSSANASSSSIEAASNGFEEILLTFDSIFSIGDKTNYSESYENRRAPADKITVTKTVRIIPKIEFIRVSFVLSKTE